MVSSHRLPFHVVVVAIPVRFSFDLVCRELSLSLSLLWLAVEYSWSREHIHLTHSLLVAKRRAGAYRHSMYVSPAKLPNPSPCLPTLLVWLLIPLLCGA